MSRSMLITRPTFRSSGPTSYKQVYLMMNSESVRDYMIGLQNRIAAELERIDGQAFRSDRWERSEGGGESRIIEDGGVFERGGVNFSRVRGERLPPSASASRPELAGRAFEAMGVSLVLHPRNPYAPTVHLNLRLLVATRAQSEPGGIGGIFFDDLSEKGFDFCFDLARSVGEHFLPAYLPILERRRSLPYGERERDFQA